MGFKETAGRASARALRAVYFNKLCLLPFSVTEKSRYNRSSGPNPSPSYTSCLSGICRKDKQEQKPDTNIRACAVIGYCLAELEF